ncbi:unnamed protein product, partial [Didymodactylos carnosus]
KINENVRDRIAAGSRALPDALWSRSVYLGVVRTVGLINSATESLGQDAIDAHIIDKIYTEQIRLISTYWGGNPGQHKGLKDRFETERKELMKMAGEAAKKKTVAEEKPKF